MISWRHVTQWTRYVPIELAPCERLVLLVALLTGLAAATAAILAVLL